MLLDEEVENQMQISKYKKTEQDAQELYPINESPETKNGSNVDMSNFKLNPHEAS